jgi:hypothetical protein
MRSQAKFFAFTRVAHSALLLCVLSTVATAEPAQDDLVQKFIQAVGELALDQKSFDALLNEIKQQQAAEAPSPAATASHDPIPAAPADLADFFETKIRPVIAEKCIECHSGETPNGGLRLDTKTGLVAGGKDGPVFVSGDPNRSLLVKALRYDGDIKMPPTGKLDEETVQVFAHWIALGAPWPETGAVAVKQLTMEERIVQARARHWAFKPVSDPSPPVVKRPDWVESPIDAFVLAKLEANDLRPSRVADKRTLIRRAYYDLIGLPPTEEEIAAFESDTSPDAFAALVDRLLAMPQYGERWGRYWLDVARYADTRGYVFQTEPNIPFSHTYRDYVIRAFNEDLPYDQFILQQLAADQLELGEDKRPLAAMGYLTLGRIFLGVQDDIADDVIDVVTRGMLGLTVTCARCHDHKYDPIPAADYYSLQGVFRSSAVPGEFPLIAQPDPNNPEYQDFLKARGEKEKELNDVSDGLYVKAVTEARTRTEEYLLASFDGRDAANDEVLQTLARDRKLKWQFVREWQAFIKKRAEAHDPVFAPFIAFAALKPEDFAAQAGALAKQFTENKTPDKPINARIANAFEGDPPKDMGEVAKRYGAVFTAVDTAWRDVLAARSAAAERNEKNPQTIPDGLNDLVAEEVRQALYGKDSPANLARRRFEQYLEVPQQNQIRDRRNALTRVESTHPGRPDRAMSLIDAEKPFDPYVYLRGKAENRGPDVPRQFLAVLTPGERKPFEKGSGRLELAHAIASKDNPLTARVLVNRVWMYHFGRPLVETTSDFGLRSEAPSHPELLDFLAQHFMQNKWSIKGLHRMMMLSSTYQQASGMNDAAFAVDPENRLLWRQNRKRLDFEAMRDSILAVAGALDLKMGGQSVDITTAPYTTRRSVYSRIDRLNFPAIFRAFDFATPDTHSPKRFRTTVPQQALFMLNSPFVVEQAKRAATRTEVASAQSVKESLDRLYRIGLRRAPAHHESESGLQFLSETTMDAPVPPWSYGYGRFNDATKTVASFTALPHYAPGQWRGSAEFPDPTLRWVSLTAGGGHPGATPDTSCIRRWRSDISSDIAISGAIKRYSEMGDGDFAYIVSSRDGMLWTSHVPHGTIDPAVLRTHVEPGDTIDFVVACGETDGYDGFEWAPEIRRIQEGATFANYAGRLEWSAAIDFAGPMPAPLAPIEQLAQVLLLTNEFMFVD